MYELVWFVIPVAIAVYFLKKEKTSGKPPPGPEQSLILGNFKDVEVNNLPQSLQKLSKTYGPIFSLRLLSRRVVVLASADVIRKAFNSEDYREEFNDKPKGFFGTHMIFGHQDVLFGPYKDVTFKVKSIMYKGIGHVQTEQHIQSEIEDFLRDLSSTSGRDTDPRPITETIMAKLHTQILKGKVEAGDTDLIWEFARSSDTLLQPSIETTLKLFPFLRHLNVRVGQLYKTALADRNRMLERFFDEQKATFSPEVTRGLVDMCFQVQKSEKNSDGTPWLTDDIIKAAIIDTIGAGVLATTNVFLALLLSVAHHPECQKKMQSEIDMVYENGQKPKGCDVKKLPYCHAVFLESLRYSSIVPIINHLCSKGDVEFEGYSIKKGSVLIGSFNSANNDETLWTDPWNFRPERFLDDQGKLLPVDHKLRQSLFSYGLGSRVCVGKSLSHIRLLVYTMAVLQHFDILPPESTELLLHDTKLFKVGPVLQVPNYQCRFVQRVELLPEK